MASASLVVVSMQTSTPDMYTCKQLLLACLTYTLAIWSTLPACLENKHEYFMIFQPLLDKNVTKLIWNGQRWPYNLAPFYKCSNKSVYQCGALIIISKLGKILISWCKYWYKIFMLNLYSQQHPRICKGHSGTIEGLLVWWLQGSDKRL